MILEIIITLAIVGCLMLGPGGIIVLLIPITLIVLGLTSKGKDNKPHVSSSSTSDSGIPPEKKEESKRSDLIKRHPWMTADQAARYRSMAETYESIGNRYRNDSKELRRKRMNEYIDILSPEDKAVWFRVRQEGVKSKESMEPFIVPDDEIKPSYKLNSVKRYFANGGS